MINIAEMLKDYPEGAKLYSPIFGWGDLLKINRGRLIGVSARNSGLFWFDEYGRYVTSGECVLFPSKDNRDWGTFKKPCSYNEKPLN